MKNVVCSEHQFASGQQLQIVHGDLTQEEVDAIINAANRHLQHGGGVTGAIARTGGAQIQRESDEWVRRHGPISHSKPAFTGEGNLPCRYVIHACGPVWGEGDEDQKLAETIQSALILANDLKLDSIAIPPISTGIFGFPKKRAALIFFQQITAFFNAHPASLLQRIRLTIIDHSTLEDFLAVWKDFDAGSDKNPAA